MSMKPGGDRGARWHSLLPPDRARQITAGSDTVALKRDVLHDFDTRPVVDRAVPNDEVVLGARAHPLKARTERTGYASHAHLSESSISKLMSRVVGASLRQEKVTLEGLRL